VGGGGGGGECWQWRKSLVDRVCHKEEVTGEFVCLEMFFFLSVLQSDGTCGNPSAYELNSSPGNCSRGCSS